MTDTNGKVVISTYVNGQHSETLEAPATVSFLNFEDTFELLVFGRMATQDLVQMAANLKWVARHHWIDGGNPGEIFDSFFDACEEQSRPDGYHVGEGHEGPIPGNMDEY